MNVNHSKSDGKNVDVNDVYMTHMKRLNEDVCEWIKKHISQNPYVDLSPVFKDYEKHLSTLEKKYRSYSVDDCDNKTMATAVTFPTSISTAASVNSSVFTSTYGCKLFSISVCGALLYLFDLAKTIDIYVVHGLHGKY